MKNIFRFIKNLILFRLEYLPCFKRKFEYFGEKSMIYYPSMISNFKDISIGNNTTILANSRIQIFNYLTGDKAKVIIGNNCYFGFHLSILAGGSIIIGNDVLIASNVLITSENHGTDPESSIPYMNQNLECKNVIIGDGCWIGEKVSILPGVTIGEKSIVGANSVVTKSIPPFSIAAGIPARVIKKYNFENHRWEKI